MAVDEGAVEQVALPEAMLGVVHKEVVRHGAAEAIVAAVGVQTQQMVAKRFHVRRPKPPDFDVQRHILTHGILADFVLGVSSPAAYCAAHHNFASRHAVIPSCRQTAKPGEHIHLCS